MKSGILIVALLLSACASLGPASGPRFIPLDSSASDKATLYIYRPDVEFNRAGSPEIFLNNEKKALLRSGGYMGFILSPGDYEIKAEGSTWGTNWWPRPAMRTLEVEAGKEYYVHVEPTLPRNVEAGPHLFAKDNVARTIITVIPKEEAIYEIAHTMLSQ